MVHKMHQLRAQRSAMHCTRPTGLASRPSCRAVSRKPFSCFSAASDTTQQLPIFPLNVVALPSATVPLIIFEPRYRVLFNTLLDGSEGVEEGLVQKDSPFCGTKRFGMCFLDGEGRLASIGTVLNVSEFVHMKDGKIYITSKGCERFKITKVVKERPVLLCEVEMLSEDDDNSSECKALAQEVSDLFRNTLKLHVKMNKVQVSEEQLEPEELTSLSPTQLSYWIASVFQDSRYTQQHLLEMDSTKSRLEQEKEVLTATLKFYSAASALEGVFKSDDTPEASAGSSSGGKDPQPPPGGPD